MAFIMEFAENLVLKLMEDPKERDRRFREHVYKTKDRCAKTKEILAKLLVEEILTMISFNTTLPHLNEWY
ncbi:hypothetical protein P8452_39071 [Trifolium repens]|nr:hypothetical protein P8452_39071 [Trifolium repens]